MSDATTEGKPFLHLIHANGFPGASYAQLATLLAARFDVYVVPMLGHDPRFPVTDGWPHLVEELAESIRAQHRAPVIGVGHSLGGYLCLLAAARWSELFRAVIMLDAPLTSPMQESAMRFVKRIGLIDRITPAHSTRNRRRHFASETEAFLHFRHKPLFHDFTDASLRDYIKFGMQPAPHGLTLRFDPDIETQIYRSFPHRLSQAARTVRCPTALIAGRSSTVVRRAGLGESRRRLHVIEIEGGHLFPFEHPRSTAHAIERLCRQWGLLS